jgi:hypothetical protein
LKRSGHTVTGSMQSRTSPSWTGNKSAPSDGIRDMESGDLNDERLDAPERPLPLPPAAHEGVRLHIGGRRHGGLPQCCAGAMCHQFSAERSAACRLPAVQARARRKEARSPPAALRLCRRGAVSINPWRMKARIYRLALLCAFQNSD